MWESILLQVSSVPALHFKCYRSLIAGTWALPRFWPSCLPYPLATTSRGTILTDTGQKWCSSLPPCSSLEWCVCFWFLAITAAILITVLREAPCFGTVTMQRVQPLMSRWQIWFFYTFFHVRSKHIFCNASDLGFIDSQSHVWPNGICSHTSPCH